MSKSRSRISRRSSGVARRKAAKSPCGSMTTEANCRSPIPRASSTTSATSSWRVLSAVHDRPTRSSRTTEGWTRVVPPPRFFGRYHSGERVMRSRRPPTVASSTTCGTASGLAWSLRSACLRRAPGTSA